jgi:ABC-type antimicrobial peptide transport system permease subunit
MRDQIHSVAVRLTHTEKNAAGVKDILDRMDKDWKELYPGTEFSYNFLNESISWLYGQEEKTAWLLKAAMIITIFISCMGLFGLAMFTAQRRTKEIGIRKVLGASVTNISALLSREFILLVGVGFVIASPIAYYFSHEWLQDFAYRTSIDVWIFLVAGLSALLIALVTVSFQAVKSAIANPVKALRTE